MSKSISSQSERLLELTRQLGMLRPRDLETHGIHREHLRRLEQRGLLVRAGRGLYTLAEASKRVPHSVICLLSALRFHNLTTQAPFEVWLAIHRKARTPQVDTLPLRIVYMSGKGFQSGIETHQIEGVNVSVYGLAKTVADCFKYRNKIGLEVALEALQGYWHEGLGTMDEIWYYAKICRVSKVMRPYLESLV